MAIFTAIAAAIGSLFTGGAFGTFVVKTLARMAVSALVGMLTKKPSPVYGTQGKLQGGDETPRQAPFGIGATEGSLVYASFWGNTGVANSHFTQVIALSDLPVKGLLRLMVDGVYVTIDTVAATGEEDLGFPIIEYRVSGVNYAWVKFYDGAQSAADPLLLGRGAHPDYPWSADAIGVGVAYAVVTARTNRELFSGFPRFRFVLDSVRLYDPSKDTTVGGSGPHRWATPSTWGGDGDYLPVVQAYNIMRGVRFNGGWVYGFQRLMTGQLPAAAWIAEINKCRATVTNSAAQSEPMFRAGGVLFFSAECGTAIGSIMAACAGRIMEIGGIYKPKTGLRGVSVGTLTDDQIITTEGQQHAPFKRLADTINAIVVKYPEPEEGYVLKDLPTIYNPDLEADDNGRRLPSQVTLDNVPYADQAQRVADIALKEARAERRHVALLPPSFYKLEPGDEITWNSDRHGYVNKPLMVNAADMLPNCHVMVDLIEVDDSGVDYDAWDGYNPITPAPVVAADPAPAVLFSFTAVKSSIKDSAGSDRRPAIKCQWVNLGLGVFRGVEIQLALASTPAAITKYFADSDDTDVTLASGVLPSTDYLVRGAPLTNTKRTFSAWIAVTTDPIKLGAADLADQVNADIADGVAALADAAAVQADHDALTSGFVGDLVTAFAEQSARSTVGWVKDPTFTDWVSGNLNTLNWWSRTGTFAYAIEGGGAYGGGITISAPIGSAEVSVIARNSTDGGLIGANATADYVVAEMEVDYLSGNPDGVFLRVEWSNDGTTWTRGDFNGVVANTAYWSSLGINPAAGVRQALSMLWKRPSGISGNIRLIFHAKRPSVADAQNMIVHRMTLRAARQADIDAGSVFTVASSTPGATVNYVGAGAAIAGMNTAFTVRAGGLEGNVTNILGTRADLLTGTSFAALLTQLGVDAGGTSAVVTAQGTAIADLEGNASASYSLRVGAGGAAAGLELVAFDDANGGPAASSVRINANNIGLFGDVLVAAGNLFPDFDVLQDGFWSSPDGAALTFGSANTTANPKLGRRYIQIAPDAADKNAYSRWFSAGASVDYLVSAATWLNGGSTASTTRVYIQTAPVSSAGVVDTASLTETLVKERTVVNYNDPAAHGKLSVVVPATHAVARFRLLRLGGGDRNARASAFQFEKKAGADLVVDGSLTAAKINTVDFEAAGVSIFGGNLKSSNYAESGGIPTAGWQLTHSGTFKGKSIILRDALEENSLQDVYQTINVTDYATPDMTDDFVLALVTVPAVGNGRLLRRGASFRVRRPGTITAHDTSDFPHVKLQLRVKEVGEASYGAWEVVDEWKMEGLYDPGTGVSSWVHKSGSGSLSKPVDGLQYRLMVEDTRSYGYTTQWIGNACVTVALLTKGA